MKLEILFILLTEIPTNSKNVFTVIMSRIFTIYGEIFTILKTNTN